MRLRRDLDRLLEEYLPGPGIEEKLRDSLLALARRHDMKNARSLEVAAEIFVRLYNHAREVARGKTSPGPFADIARLNIVRKALSDAQSTKSTKPTKEK